MEFQLHRTQRGQTSSQYKQPKIVKRSQRGTLICFKGKLALWPATYAEMRGCHLKRLVQELKSDPRDFLLELQMVRSVGQKYLLLGETP